MKMKTKISAAATALLSLAAVYASAAAMGTAFTYQGKLNVGTNVANGAYDLRFTLYDAASGGSAVGGPLATNGLAITSGLFTVTLDFGGGVFAGEARWLAIEARTNGAVSFTLLAPRQPLAPAPYALFAPSAGAAATAGTATLANNVANNAVTAAGIASGQVVKSLNGLRDAVTLAAGTNATLTTNGQTLTLATPSDWHLGGNAGTTDSMNFLGTTDNQPLELRVNGQRALRLEPTSLSPNLIGGYSGNGVWSDIGPTVGATIGGGGASGAANRVVASFTTIAGGAGNQIQSQSDYAGLGGGRYNSIRGGYYSFLGGGWSNAIQAEAWASVLGGGQGNSLQAGADHSFLGGGYANSIDATNAFLGGGSLNSIQPNAGGSFLGGGYYNSIQRSAVRSFLGGGGFNSIQPDAPYATISGGESNIVGATSGTVAGGYANTAAGRDSVVGGGFLNIAEGLRSTVPGGHLNQAAGDYSFAAGRRAQARNAGSFVWADSTDTDFSSTGANQFLIRASGGVGIGTSNPGGAMLNVTGQVRATAFQGDGSGLTGLSVANLGGGTITSLVNFNPPGSGPPFTTGNHNIATGLNADYLDGWHADHYWQMGGNVGAGPQGYFGTLDNQTLQFIVNGQLALRLEPNANGAANVIGGASANWVWPGTVAAVIAGGGGASYPNNIASHFATIGGGGANGIGSYADSATIGGGAYNNIDHAPSSTISGGGYNVIQAQANSATIGGGDGNRISFSAQFATIGGGQTNTIQDSGYHATIGGGWQNTIQTNATVSTIAGGFKNTIQSYANFSAIGGGAGNLITGQRATIPGGENNAAYGNYSFAAGRQARAAYDGCFVWADSTDAPFSSTDRNQFLIRASGGVGIGTTSPDSLLQVQNPGDNGGAIRIGANAYYPHAEKKIRFGDSDYVTIGESGTTDDLMELNAGSFVFTHDPRELGRVGIGRTPTANMLEVEGEASKTTSGAWALNSDARIKRDIQAITGALDTLAKVRLVQFRYTDEYRAKHPSAEDRPYVNVIAQEFQEVFPDSVKSSREKLADGREILQVDTHPLTIYSAAAVQELNLKVEARSQESEARSQKLEAKNAALEKEVAELKALVKTLAAKVNGAGQ
jgi:hypothetical protein